MDTLQRVIQVTGRTDEAGMRFFYHALKNDVQLCMFSSGIFHLVFLDCIDLL